MSWVVPIPKGTCVLTRTPQANLPQTNKKTQSLKIARIFAL